MSNVHLGRRAGKSPTDSSHLTHPPASRRETDEYTETRTLRKSLTKADIRDVAKFAFPGLTTGYAEQTEGMDVAGVLLVGDKHQSLWCKRGQERHMRQAFLETIQAAWRATQGDGK